MASDFVDYKLSSNNSKYGISVIDHQTRSLDFVAISDKSGETVSCVLVERVCSVSSAPVTLHSHLGSGLEKEHVKYFKSVFVPEDAQVRVSLTRQFRFGACSSYNAC